MTRPISTINCWTSVLGESLAAFRRDGKEQVYILTRASLHRLGRAIDSLVCNQQARMRPWYNAIGWTAYIEKEPR